MIQELKPTDLCNRSTFFQDMLTRKEVISNTPLDVMRHAMELIRGRLEEY